MNLLSPTGLDIQTLIALSQKPDPFAPGEPLFWNDPHISKGMLEAHLSPDTGAASRPPDDIAAIVDHLVTTLALKAGDRLLDLGCGPGLYAERFAERGLRVTGIDYSRRSIDYARQQATEKKLDIAYIYQDFTTLDTSAEFDVALQIYGELNVFAPAARDDLLRRIYRALKPGGRFVFDVTTRAHRKKNSVESTWYARESGFWKPGPHVVLQSDFDYPEQDLYLRQYAVIEANGALSVYRNWYLDYSIETISAVVKAQGFHIVELWGDLTGAPPDNAGDWLAVVAQRPA